MTVKVYNIHDKGTAHTPLFIVHGECTDGPRGGIVTVSNKKGAYPPLYYEVNAGFFKAPVNLVPGENDLEITHCDGQMVNGFPKYKGGVVSSLSITINYQPLKNKPVHLCLLVAKDSPGFFDTTSIKSHEEGNGIDLAVMKLKVAARLMQAFTNEQMLRAGFGSRTFNFAEEYAVDTLFDQEKNRQVKRDTVKVHVIRSKKTLRELRDPNVAQQNSKGTNTGGLFSIAMDELKSYPPLANEQRPLQAAVMFLDTHWDPKLKLILTHAALGGGDGDVKLAIFGSHGLYSWPSSLERVAPCFQDDTKSNINEVANDCNECGSYWECFNITFGAFLHEIGHLLGCPHQVNGVMLRDYVTINRSFTSRETSCIRTNSRGRSPLMPKDECGWHKLDLMRFLHHPSFRLLSDSQDPTFGLPAPGGGPQMLPMGNGTANIKSTTGVYAIEVIKDDLAHGFLEFSPRSLGGTGVQHDVYLTLPELNNLLPVDKRGGEFDVRILSAGGETFHNNVVKLLTDSSNSIIVDLGTGKGSQTAIRSGTLGDANRGKQIQPCLFNPERIINVRVYWGGALDGVRFDIGADPKPQQGPPPVPERDYKNPFSKMVSSFKDMGVTAKRPTTESTVLVGNMTNNYSDFPLQAGETITEFRLRTGAWIDAIQIVTSTGRVSEMFGNKNGGGENKLAAPSGFQIIGMFGSVGQWLDSIGIFYAPV